MMQSADGVWENIAVMAGMTTAYPQGLSEAALVVTEGHLRWIGPHSALPSQFAGLKKHDGHHCLVSAGLIDCHTHLIYGGNRADEFSRRLAGISYAEIAQSGGGIMSTVRATREASEEQLYAQAAQRLQGFLAEGGCALEIKSGYGLTLESERKMLRVARRLSKDFRVTISNVFLGAHAVPPEFSGRQDDYVDAICKRILPTLHDEGLVDAVDVFCDHIAFSLSQTERIFSIASARGLPVKIHAEQLSDQGGAALAAAYHALSADHLEYLSPEGIAAMKKANTVAVLLPGAFYTLRETKVPPIEALRAAGISMAVASDHNPGTSPVLSLLATLNMASTLFRMTVPEVLAGVTRHAAQALGLQHSHGQLHMDQLANFVLWPVENEAELVYWFGASLKPRVIRQGHLMESIHA